MTAISDSRTEISDVPFFSTRPLYFPGYHRVSSAFMIPYTSIAIAICLLVVFYQIGELDEDIGNPLGLLIGILVVAAVILFPGGYVRLALYAIAGFALLTLYKMVR